MLTPTLVLLIGVVVLLAAVGYQQFIKTQPQAPVGMWWDPILETVKPMYDAPGRHYHDWKHITEGLEFFVANRGMFTTSDLLAWVFHDVVYIPGAHDNEHQSAELMRMVCTANMGWDILYPNVVDEAADKILNTISHTAEGCFVSNVDLLRLGASPAEFAHNNHTIYNEYKEAGVVQDVSEFVAGQIKFFNHMLARDTIYTHPLFSQYEIPAQRNLRSAVTFYETNPDRLLGVDDLVSN